MNKPGPEWVTDTDVIMVIIRLNGLLPGDEIQFQVDDELKPRRLTLLNANTVADVHRYYRDALTPGWKPIRWRRPTP